MTSNRDIADFINAYATYMELKGENSFRIRAYTNAARTVEFMEDTVVDLIGRDALKDVKGIGGSMAALIGEFVETGSAQAYEEMKASVPPGLMEMLRVQGIGPKKVRQVHEELGIESLEGLEAAAADASLTSLKGFGAKTVDKILQSIAFLRQNRGLFRLHTADSAAADLHTDLAAMAAVERVEIAGALRRNCELVPRVDLVIQSDEPSTVSDAFTQLAAIAETLETHPHRISVRLRNGLEAQIHLATADNFGFLLHQCTGSKAYLENVAQHAAAKGLKLDGSGLSRDGQSLALPDEDAFFTALDLPYIAPELREGNGEVQAAAAGDLPNLVPNDAIRGMLHVHSTYSDGRDTLAEMAEAVRQRGYTHLGICDHSKTASYAGGLKEDQIKAQHAEIDQLNQDWDDFRIFKGIESDILPDGSLDYTEEVLASFDFIVVSVHSVFNMPSDQMTQRIVRAIEHPAATIVGHLTGRLLLEREGYPVDVDQILEATARCGVAIEINANPFRLDMDWRHVKQARDMGVKLAINTDAHRTEHLDYLGYGVGIGRKGWLRKEDVLNTLDTEAFAAFCAARHA
jgi:DNA polymerase (family X)